MWQARFEDGSILNQITEKGDKRSYQEVLDKVDVLETLTLIAGTNKRLFNVHLKSGRFGVKIHDSWQYFFFNDYNQDTLTDFQPIYFERYRHDFTLEKGIQEGTLDFIGLGYSAIYKGERKRIYLAINSKRSFCLKVE